MANSRSILRLHYRRHDAWRSCSPHGGALGWHSERMGKTIVRANGEEFCRPYPLGIVQAKLTSRLLWPGQSLSTGEEATAARDGFSIGDKPRFVIYTGAGRAEPVKSPPTSSSLTNTARMTCQCASSTDQQEKLSPIGLLPRMGKLPSFGVREGLADDLPRTAPLPPNLGCDRQF